MLNPSLGLVAQADATAIPLAAETVDLTVIDPPYAVLRFRDEIKRHGAKSIERFADWDDLTPEQYERLLVFVALELWRVSKPGASLYIFFAAEMTTRVKLIFESLGWHWRLPCFWHKTNPAPKVRDNAGPQSSVEPFALLNKPPAMHYSPENRGRDHNWHSIDRDVEVIETPLVGRLERMHQTQKPRALMSKLISVSSRPDDLVLDCFCGSGVVGRAANELGRRSFCSDLDWRHIRDMASFSVNNRAGVAAVADLPLFAKMESA